MPPETIALNEAVEEISEPVIEAGSQCKHIMAINFDPDERIERGIIRCVVNRTGVVTAPGFVDTSQIHLVDLESSFQARMGEELQIERDQAVISELPEYNSSEFLGFEDPNIWYCQKPGTLHFYCTIPFLNNNTGNIVTYLGHAEGPDLDSLTMTAPVLDPDVGSHRGAKEVAIAPQSDSGVRYNLVESDDIVNDTIFSVLRTAIAPTLSGPWEYGGIALHPNDYDYDWCRGHVSPGPFFPQTAIDVGDDRRVGLLNGREAGTQENGIGEYGKFSVGLMIYEFQEGSIEWISEEPLISDPSAETITFASAFRQVGPNDLVVYAHIDDSYVSAFLVDTDELDAFVP